MRGRYFDFRYALRLYRKNRVRFAWVRAARYALRDGSAV